MNIALDIDGVIANTDVELARLHPERVITEYGIPGLDWKKINYIDIPLLDKPEFSFNMYITSRSTSRLAVTNRWLAKHGLPKRPIICATYKLPVMCAWDIDVLVDDKPATFHEVNKHASKICYLYSQHWNMHINTQLRINNLNELKERLNLL